MDGPNGSAADGRKKKKEEEETEESTIPERVTLKKEIGLLSACTIIIGELQLPVTAAATLCRFRRQQPTDEKALKYKTPEEEKQLGRVFYKKNGFFCCCLF